MHTRQPEAEWTAYRDGEATKLAYITESAEGARPRSPALLTEDAMKSLRRALDELPDVLPPPPVAP